MRRLFLFGSGAVLVCAFLSCISPEQVKLPDDPNDPVQLSEFQNAIKDLPQDEQKDINDFIARMAAAKEAGGYGYVVGTRAHEALEKQRKWINEEQEREQKESELKERLARETKARSGADEEAERKMHAICDVKLTKKKFLPANKNKMTGERLSMTLKFENKSDKDLVAVMGKLEFRDAQGRLLKEIKIPVQESIKAKKSATWSGDLPCNMGKEQDAVLAKIPIADLKVVWIPESYDFADGTRIGKGI
jgi:hypothetical protein